MSSDQPETTDIVERLREFAGERYPDDICGKACMGDAADEIERLRSALEQIGNPSSHGWTLQTEIAREALANEQF